ncbi:MAG: pyrroline-5-carboxylate reductase [Thaumarchaeota archaeon]|nr:pyrroline-5-carboxylate reductase [Nitrososphaerota archaeon]
MVLLAEPLAGAGKSKVIVAVLGGGKIGEAVGKSISQSKGVSKVIMTKRNISTIQHLASPKLEITIDNLEAARKADLIIISVKAGDARSLLKGISRFTSGKIVISLMAAISIKNLQSALPRAKIVRSMPNIAATIGEAITAYSPAPGLSKKELDDVKSVLGCFGDYIQIPESLMNAVTALSGSGPAYIATLIEAMISGGLMVGMPRDVAFKLVTKTLTGTANLLERKKMHPAELRDTVTTPAGTTIAGIYELERGSFRTSIMNAVDAATRAAEKVAKKFEGEG